MKDSWNIAAVFATMNRVATAEECLRRLAGQGRRPDFVVVTDNASTDGTAERLREVGAGLGLPLEVLALDENLGNAGGVEKAMDRAFAKGAEAVWLLDDDSWPEPQALESLCGDDGPEEGIRCSVVLAPEGSLGSWPLEVPAGHRRWRIDWDVFGEAAGPWIEVRRAWLGALIPLEAYRAVGPVRGELFLRGEDEDYPRRLGRAGYRFWLSARSVLRHPRAGDLMVFEFLGRRVCLERGLRDDKLYYRIRNMIWIKRNEAGTLQAAMLALGYCGLLLLKGESPRGRNLRVFFEALGHAWSGRLGKRVRNGA